MSVRVVSQLPPDWPDAYLDITRVARDLHGAPLEIEIRGPDGNGSSIFPSPDLGELAMKFFQLFEENGKPLKKVSFRLFKSETGGWRYNAKMFY